MFHSRYVLYDAAGGVIFSKGQFFFQDTNFILRFLYVHAIVLPTL